jgi:hypothetical protein
MGACFHVSGGEGPSSPPTGVRVLATRKGLRMWVAEPDGGSVLSTLKFPSTPSLVFASGSTQPPVASSKKTQFGRVALFTALRPLTVREFAGVLQCTVDQQRPAFWTHHAPSPVLGTRASTFGFRGAGWTRAKV